MERTILTQLGQDLDARRHGAHARLEGRARRVDAALQVGGGVGDLCLKSAARSHNGPNDLREEREEGLIARSVQLLLQEERFCLDVLHAGRYLGLLVRHEVGTRKSARGSVDCGWRRGLWNRLCHNLGWKRRSGRRGNERQAENHGGVRPTQIYSSATPEEETSQVVL